MKILTTFLILCFLSSNSFAATGFKELFENYQYAVTVEWDQQDQVFLKNEENKFINGIDLLVQNGHSTEEIIIESLELIHDKNLRNEIEEALKLFGSKNISKNQLLTILDQNAVAMSQQGSSWSTIGKILVGAVVTYGVLKLLMIIIIYSDTDPNYGQPGDAPPK